MCVCLFCCYTGSVVFIVCVVFCCCIVKIEEVYKQPGVCLFCYWYNSVNILCLLGLLLYWFSRNRLKPLLIAPPPSIAASASAPVSPRAQSKLPVAANIDAPRRSSPVSPRAPTSTSLDGEDAIGGIRLADISPPSNDSMSISPDKKHALKLTHSRSFTVSSRHRSTSDSESVLFAAVEAARKTNNIDRKKRMMSPPASAERQRLKGADLSKQLQIEQRAAAASAAAAMPTWQRAGLPSPSLQTVTSADSKGAFAVKKAAVTPSLTTQTLIKVKAESRAASSRPVSPTSGSDCDASLSGEQRSDSRIYFYFLQTNICFRYRACRLIISPFSTAPFSSVCQFSVTLPHALKKVTVDIFRVRANFGHR